MHWTEEPNQKNRSAKGVGGIKVDNRVSGRRSKLNILWLIWNQLSDCRPCRREST